MVEFFPTKKTLETSKSDTEFKSFKMKTIDTDVKSLCPDKQNKTENKRTFKFSVKSTFVVVSLLCAIYR